MDDVGHTWEELNKTREQQLHKTNPLAARESYRGGDFYVGESQESRLQNSTFLSPGWLNYTSHDERKHHKVDKRDLDVNRGKNMI